MRNDLTAGALFSFSLHAVLLALLLGKSFGSFVPPPPLQVYSVSIEGGEKLGGISQVPKDEKSQKAPPKKAVEETPKEKPEVSIKEKPKKKEPEKKVEPKPVPKDTEVVSVSTPEPKPSKAPKPSPEPVKPSPKPKTKPSPPPAKKKQPAKPKPKPKPTKKKLSLEEIDKRLEKSLQRYTGESSDAGGSGFGAAKLGGRGSGGGVVRPPEFFRYRDLIERSVKNDWAWHDRRRALSASVCFSISPAGVVSDVRLCADSASSFFNQSVVRAVKKANPLPPPPASVQQFFKSVRIHFSSLE